MLAVAGTPLTTYVILDIAGNPLIVTDARGNAIQTQTFDMLGRPLRTVSPDAGDSDALLDVVGQPLMVWKTGGLLLLATFDALRRRTRLTVTENGTSSIREVVQFGESAPNPEAHFLRGKPWRLWDTAGRVETPEYDFKGNPLTSTRRFWDRVGTGTDVVTWDATPDAGDLETEAFTTSQTFDALNRPTTQTAPDTTVTILAYGAGGQLDSVTVGGTDYVTSISYNARGQRDEIAYANGVTTTHTYDAQTFRLTRLRSVRSSDGAVLQDLVYSYDPVGNITEIVNDADDTVYFANTAVSPDQQFTYDSLYRLISATGREKTALGFVPPGTEPAFGTLPDLNTAVQRYTQTYSYDDVGNILEMAHVVSFGSAHNWTRASTYATACNRIVSSTVGSNTETFVHDARGSIVYLPHLRFSSSQAPNIVTDFRDQMVVAELATAGHSARYWYDSAGQRVRKVVVKGAMTEERKYIGGFEVWRKSVNGTLTEERTTLHVADGQERIALIEKKTLGTNAPLSRVRFQLGNHLGTAVLEVDHTGALISYEEYYPYGTTAWQANNGDVEVSAKRYKYTGMERDEETGLQCHGVRYYMTWLGRWLSTDPIGLSDGVNIFIYCHNKMINRLDINGSKDNDSQVLNFQHVEIQYPTIPLNSNVVEIKEEENYEQSLWRNSLITREELSQRSAVLISDIMSGNFKLKIKYRYNEYEPSNTSLFDDPEMLLIFTNKTRQLLEIIASTGVGYSVLYWLTYKAQRETYIGYSNESKQRQNGVMSGTYGVYYNAFSSASLLAAEDGSESWWNLENDYVSAVALFHELLHSFLDQRGRIPGNGFQISWTIPHIILKTPMFEIQTTGVNEFSGRYFTENRFRQELNLPRRQIYD